MAKKKKKDGKKHPLSLRKIIDEISDADKVLTGLDLRAEDSGIPPYRVMVETMSEGFVTLKRDGTILYCNRCFADIVGLPREKAFGASIYGFIDDQDRQAFDALVRVASLGSGKMELSLRIADKTTAPVFLSLKAFNDNDIPDALCMVVSDLREQKRDEAILAAERLTNQILDQAAEIFVVCNDQGGIIRASRSTIALLGRSPLFQPFDQAFHFQYSDGAPFSLLPAMDQHLTQAVEVTRERENGEHATFLLSANPLVSDKGLLGLVVVIMDITERKGMDMALRERTEQLEMANKELESFCYSVSHDLRAPLRAIDGYARMILKQYGAEFPEGASKKFEEIRNSAQMMGRLIEDLLTFSRLGRKELSMCSLDMEGIIREVWKDLRVSESGRRIALTVNALPSGYGDRNLIRQVLANLLENAVKFTRRRDEALIEAGGSLCRDGECRYYIRDNGVGFDMKYCDKLFGVFQRLHSAEDFEGTGVGLATVQRIITRHGGRVWAEGKVDEGACFHFTLKKD